MSLILTDAEVRSVARVSAILLAPFDHTHVDGWRAAVNRELCALFAAESAGFMLPDTGGALIYSQELLLQDLEASVAGSPPDLPDGTSFWVRCISMGPCTAETIYAGDDRPFRASAYYNELAVPMGAAETLTTHVTLGPERARGVAVGAVNLQTTTGLYVWRPHGGRRFGPRELGLLTLLAPSFHAGVDAERRYRAARGALLATLDGLGQAVLVCDTRGSAVHETPALAGLLAADPERATLRLEMRFATAAVCRVAGGAGRVSAPGAATRPTREVRTARARYRVSATVHSEATAPGPEAQRTLVLVVLEALTPILPSPADVRAAFGLTAAEARVALLLAEGRSNAAIAAETGTTTSTARRHTERVLQKLGVGSRAAVAHRLAGRA
jgi:DNA-binding NarL/FixJ family response regulator